MFTKSLAAPLRALPRLSRPAPASFAPIFSLRSYSDAAAAEPSESAPAPSESEKRVTELEAELKELKKEMQYARADYQTLSRRSAEEKSKASEFAITKFAASLLSTADVLTTALKHVKTPIDPTNKSLLDLYSGVELTHKALLKTFEQHGVKPFENTAGEPFNPNFHEATFQIPKEVAPKKADGSFHAPGDVVEVAKDGWMIKDRVLRPAQVGVVQIE